MSSTLSLPPTSLSPSPDLQPHQQWGLNNNIVVIIAAVVCAVVCALGLNSMLRCVLVCVHRALTEPVGWVSARILNSGLRKKDVVSLPTSVYPGMMTSSSSAAALRSCAICLVDLCDGDSVRFLPNCGHGFHVVCIDQWLLSHSSCPNCRLHLNPHHTCFNIPPSL